MNRLYNVLLLVIVFATCSAQYHVREGENPSYLYHKFHDIKSEIFPEDLIINMSLSIISGTLLYSIDRNMNQLIVSLSFNEGPEISIEFREKINKWSIHELCQCQMCRFEFLVLRIQVNTNVLVQCNSNEAFPSVIKSTKNINKHYYNPYKNNNISTYNNEANLWLVNYPNNDNMYTNWNQLSGCIFYVSYKGQIIKFTNISSNIERKCQKVCDKNICNGGLCYDAYKTSPICNCTFTFRNGPYCNDTRNSSLNIHFKSQRLQQATFKLSWKSASKEIFILKNQIDRIRLFREDNALCIEYWHNNSEVTITKKILSNQYEANKETIFIAEFQKKNIHCQLFINGKISSMSIWTKRNLKRYIFDSLTLRSGKGLIDFVYKRLTTDTEWIRDDFTNATTLTDDEVDSRWILLKAENIGLIIVAIVVLIMIVIIGVTKYIERGTLNNEIEEIKKNFGRIIDKGMNIKDQVDSIETSILETSDRIEKIKESAKDKKFQNNEELQKEARHLNKFLKKFIIISKLVENEYNELEKYKQKIKETPESEKLIHDDRNDPNEPQCSTTV